MGNIILLYKTVKEVEKIFASPALSMLYMLEYNKEMGYEFGDVRAVTDEKENDKFSKWLADKVYREIETNTYR